MNWEKLGNIRSPKPSFGNLNFEAMDEMGKVYSNLSFPVENKMVIVKKGWSHFEPSINNWDIPFPKCVRINQWIGKKFSSEENGMSPLEILPIPQNVLPKGPGDMYF